MLSFIKCFERVLIKIISICFLIYGETQNKCVDICSKHERDSRQSQSRSGEISKLSRRHFSGFREKVPFSLIKAAGKLRLGTTLNGTRAVHFFTFQRSGRGTEQTQKMPVGERQSSVGIRST